MPGLADAVVTGVLGEAVLRDGDAVVREVAALALLRVAVGLRTLGGAARPVSAALSTALSRDQSAIVRKLCAWALGTIWAAGEGDDPADASESDSHLVLLAETLASDPDPHVRRNAADALGRIGGDEFAACLCAPADKIASVSSQAAGRIVAGVAGLGNGVGCSVGVAIGGDSELEVLLDRADKRMLAEKKLRRSRLV